MIVGQWAIFGLFFPVPGMWACYWFCLLSPGCGVLLGCFVSSARMWVLGAGGLFGCLCWLCPYVGD